MSPILQARVSLRPFNAFKVEAEAAWFARLGRAEELPALEDDPRLRGLPWLVLGGGTNVLFTGDFPGLVLQVAIPGVRPAGETATDRLLEVGAGEDWPALVSRLLEDGQPGLENLALIPGRAGAAPVQNIGAYGLELAERLQGLVAWDRRERRALAMDAEQCNFGYRDSVFKREPGRYIVTGLTLRLPRQWRPVTAYAELERELAQRGAATPQPRDIHEAVCALRRRKLPDPAQLGNAGSFFKNPVVSRAQQAALIERHPSLVSYPLAGGRFKLAAGWLIEACGFKGASRGRAGVYERQALVLVNRGGASGGEILALAREIQQQVKERFGVALEPEAVIV